MQPKLYTPKQLATLFGVTTQTLIDWENDGKIKAIKTQGGHRRYVHNVSEPVQTNEGESKKKYIYARVSSSKQVPDLQRQIAVLQKTYPNHDIIQDIGSGINFKRRGLITLLESVFGGNVSEVVVAHKDRLTRFGFDLFQFIFEKFGVSIKVLSDDDVKEPINELARDLLSVVTVFTARYYGARKYNLLPKDQVLSKQRTNYVVKPVRRSIKVLLQQNRKLHK